MTDILDQLGEPLIVEVLFDTLADVVFFVKDAKEWLAKAASMSPYRLDRCM